MSKLPSARPEIRRVLLTGALGNIGRRIIQGLGADFELVPTEIRSSEEGPEILIADHVFEAARRGGVRRSVYASSLTIYYGDKPRPSFVTREDIGRAVAAEVKSAETSGIFNVVSDSDNLRFELESARRMGYVPSGRFREQGLFRRTSEEAPWVMESPTVRELISENQ